ncbi:MAG: hypothetical protein LBS97_06480 [Treponema sp.]|jgi:hypothetical protein|nr:hypothetical protein [Treponema sp.]
MKKLNKSTLAAFGIAIGLVVLVAGLLVGMWAGCSPVLLDTAPASKDGGIAWGPPLEVEGELSPAGNGELLLVLHPFGKNSPARNVFGAGNADIQSTDRGVRNYAQVIVMEDSSLADGTISAFDQTTASKTALSVRLKSGKTYHFLILQGHKNDLSSQGEKPTLLAGGYAKKSISPGLNTVTLPLVPVIVDVTLIDDTGNDVVINPGFNRRALVNYTPAQAALSPGAVCLAQVKLGAVQAGANAAGDGLWPLKLAEPGIRRDGSTWEGNSVPGAQDSYATKISLGGYSGGNAALDAAGITVTQNAGHYVFASSDAPLADSLAAGAQTAGSLQYAFTTGDAKGTGRFYFNLKYVPFAVTADRWDQTGMPVWVIRNGFDDQAQDGNTDFAANPGSNGHGAISITVGGQPSSLMKDLTAFIGTPKTADGPNPSLDTGSSNTGSFETGQYTGTVTWSHGNTAHTGVIFDPVNEGFWRMTVYTATVALTAKAGYTFANLSANQFSHTDAASATNPPVGAAPNPDQVTVTILFPATASDSGDAGSGRIEW